MRAAVLLDGSDQLDIADVDHDEPIGREVLMRTVAAGLCHSDYHYLDGTLNRPRPVILGHEGAGVVEAVGPDVRDIHVGDHVVTCLVMGCGECVRCIAGEPTSCLDPGVTKRPKGHRPRLTLDGVNVGQMANVGSLADHILLDERAVTAVNTDIPMELACILGCAVVTGLGAVLNTADVQPGESVAVSRPRARTRVSPSDQKGTGHGSPLAVSASARWPTSARWLITSCSTSERSRPSTPTYPWSWPASSGAPW